MYAFSTEFHLPLLRSGRSIMRSTIVVAVAWLLVAPAARAQAPKFVYVDIQPKANGKLADLAGVPKGKQTLLGVKLKIGDGLISVACDPRSDPGRVQGIKAGTTCRKLYFLHACHYGTPVPDTIIGYYTVTYEDKSQVTIPLVYGKDIANWWYGPNEGGPSRARVAWKGTNDAVKKEGGNIRLYMTTWKNPEPKKKVVSIDFGATTCRYAIRPFCLAITAEK
jgi:hypothetical protein